MKKFGFILLLLTLSVPIVRAAESYGNLHNVQYISTLSGRSFLADIPGQHPLIGRKIEVVLKGIDVPDRKGVCRKERERAEKAVQLVDFMLTRASSITLKNVERGRRFRLTATVLIDGNDIRETLIKKGFAVNDRGLRGGYDWCK